MPLYQYICKRCGKVTSTDRPEKWKDNGPSCGCGAGGPMVLVDGVTDLEYELIDPDHLGYAFCDSYIFVAARERKETHSLYRCTFRYLGERVTKLHLIPNKITGAIITTFEEYMEWRALSWARANWPPPNRKDDE